MRVQHDITNQSVQFSITTIGESGKTHHHIIIVPVGTPVTKDNNDRFPAWHPDDYSFIQNPEIMSLDFDLCIPNEKVGLTPGQSIFRPA